MHAGSQRAQASQRVLSARALGDCRRHRVLGRHRLGGGRNVSDRHRNQVRNVGPVRRRSGWVQRPGQKLRFRRHRPLRQPQTDGRRRSDKRQLQHPAAAVRPRRPLHGHLPRATGWPADDQRQLSRRPHPPAEQRQNHACRQRHRDQPDLPAATTRAWGSNELHGGSQKHRRCLQRPLRHAQLQIRQRRAIRAEQLHASRKQPLLVQIHPGSRRQPSAHGHLFRRFDPPCEPCRNDAGPDRLPRWRNHSEGQRLPGAVRERRLGQRRQIQRRAPHTVPAERIRHLSQRLRQGMVHPAGGAWEHQRALGIHSGRLVFGLASAASCGSVAVYGR